MSVLEIRDLVVERGTFQLGPITMALEPGEILCVAGPNGAGKTTLLSSLLGMVPVTSGAVDAYDRPVDFAARTHLSWIGYIPDDPELLLDELTAHEYWRFLAAMRGQEDSTDVMHLAEEFADCLEFDPGKCLIRGFSHGMRKKTQIIAALMHRPGLIVVDELRNGLDPIAARAAEDLVMRFRDDGTGILVSTHDLYWAERHANSVIFLSHGQVLARGTPDSIRSASDASLEDAFIRMMAHA